MPIDPNVTQNISKPGLDPGLYLVATPIGNLRDITLRALDVLAKADSIVCEDTRVTQKLLNAHGITAKLAVYNDQSSEADRNRFIRRLKSGQSMALVSDAGTPLVSDPGYKLVRAAEAAGLPVTAVPGPSAILNSLVISGLPLDRFLFLGFLPSKQGERRRALEEVADIDASLVAFESPRRLPASLHAMAEILGPRPAAVTRELTKRFEEVRRGSLASLASYYEEAGPPKGEIVVVIAPPLADGTAQRAADVDRLLQAALESHTLRDAVAAVVEATGMGKRDVYRRALELSSNDAKPR